jgi:hypothetical protein
MVKDSLALRIAVSDSLNQTLDSLLYVKFEESTRNSEKFTYRIELKDGQVNKLWKSKLTFNKPVAHIHYDSIYFKFDSLFHIPITDSMLTANYNNDEYSLTFNFNNYRKEDSLFSTWAKPFELVMAAGSIISVENDSITKVTKKYSFKQAEDFGIIRGKVNTDYDSYVIQLVDNNFDLVEEFTAKEIKQNTYQFLHIAPGDYSIRVLVDENNNGIWDPGNILNLEPPESVKLFFHPNSDGKKISLRPNWEQSGLDIVF